ncbi:serine protease [Coprinopsis sp. MPI-PUGE-AT-0042]|nr:serine protease [Coprinopsis sp. MPI-PUGE-AT-0042]
MRFLSLFAALAIVLPALISAAPQGPAEKGIKRFSGPKKKGGYIVKLKPGVSKKQLAKKLGIPAKSVDLGLINGFSGDLNEDVAAKLAAADEVEYVAEDGYAQSAAAVYQYNAGWPLKRISQVASMPSGSNIYNQGFQWQYDSTAGTGVDVYVIDTGIYTAHTEFQGRAVWGGTFGVPGNSDDTGHGTHCAGSVGGFMFGVAKNSSLIAVKVLASNGQGPISGIIEGLEWIGQQAALKGRPSVVSMSILAFGTSQAYDDAVEALVAQGVHVVTAAGNENDDAANWSPARTPGAITVGATDITDTRAWFSNYGSIVDVFAPGVDVTGPATQFPTAQTMMSGTSMATPHVAGLVAYLIAKDGNISPAAMSTKVKNLASVGYLHDLPAGTGNRIIRVPL